uniref:putative UPF0481 protein At3g02645 n=1 Tax=Erigeron canadensis TaxID=72917 RepID=UPI001CB9A6B6|nr:putative UPF0481 protein At3g02645 [Erigeron canadensis]
MAFCNPFLSPNSGGNKPWVDQISKNLQTQLAVTIDTPPVSVFLIQKTWKEEHLEEYVPQRIGLGPNHHFQPELYQMMEQNKLTAVRRLLKPYQIHDCQQQIVAKVKEIVPILRTCYETYLDADDDTLAWLFAIDGMFLLDQLDSYINHGFVIEAKDLVMLENQIPLIVLKEIKKVLLSTIDQTALSQLEDYLESKFRFFCKSRSPFLLSEENIDFSKVNHLLDYMYNSIVNNETSIPIKVDFTPTDTSDPTVEEPTVKDAKLELLDAVIKIAVLIPAAQSIIDFIKKIMFPEMNGQKTIVEEIKVPSVSELNKTAKIKFRLLPGNEGIRNINFVEGKERICYLPLITLNIDSEVTVRNLVAYEKSMANNSHESTYGLELTEYVDFMCGIVDTAKDVKLLREGKIIQSDLSDEQIVKLFNGIRKSQGKMNIETELRKTLVQLNKVYESTPTVWIQRLFEKQFRVWAKTITFLVGILSTLIVIREVYLKVNLFIPLRHMMLVQFFEEKWSRLLIFFIKPKGPVV